MLCVSSNPFVIVPISFPKFIGDFQPRDIEWVFVVREVGPNAPSCWLVKMPMRSLNRFNGQFDAGSAVPHVDIEGRQWRTGCSPWGPQPDVRQIFRQSLGQIARFVDVLRRGTVHLERAQCVGCLGVSTGVWFVRSWSVRDEARTNPCRSRPRNGEPPVPRWRRCLNANFLKIGRSRDGFSVDFTLHLGAVHP